MLIDVYTVVRPFLQPIIGAFHGWFATRMVVVMLFRPHKVYYIWGKQVPFKSSDALSLAFSPAASFSDEDFNLWVDDVSFVR